MQSTSTIAALAAALAAAQAEIKAAKMDALNPFLKNRYASLGAVIDAVREPLARHGLAVMQLISGDGGSIAVETVLTHESGEWVSTVVSLPVGEERGKSAAQVAGSIITYLRRYSLAAMLGVYADEDTDGNNPPTSRPSTQQQPRQQRPAAADQPLTPAALRDAIQRKAAAYRGNGWGGYDADKRKTARGMLASRLDEMLGGKTRYELCRWLAGSASTGEMDDCTVRAMLDWTERQQAAQEARAAHAEALRAQGQQTLPEPQTTGDGA